MTTPLKFLGLTVLSVNSQLGLGSNESSCSIDLIRDCEAGDVPNSPAVGGPVFFEAGNFRFGGILSSFNRTLGGSGDTYNVKIVDPRQLLENFVIIIDSYLGPPIISTNYFNAYAAYEQSVFAGDCSAYGTAGSSDRGMIFYNIATALNTFKPPIFSSTGYSYIFDWQFFLTLFRYISADYRISGPSITLLQLLQTACDAVGFEFFVNLIPNTNINNPPIIDVGYINLRTVSSENIGTIISSYNGQALELSYGQELRNEVTKTVLFGEKQHYLTLVENFNHFFGEDSYDSVLVPVVPFGYDACGFWINKKIESLNLSLTKPLQLNGNGPYTIHELDIRAAMASEELWKMRVMSKDIPGTFNAAVRANWPDAVPDIGGGINTTLGQLGAAIDTTRAASDRFPVIDKMNNASRPSVKTNQEIIIEDLTKCWQFIKNLGDTFYGKQFLSPLNEYICWYRNYENSEIVYSVEPTNAGGWIDNAFSVLSLTDPELGLFKADDNRVNCFAVFTVDGLVPFGENPFPVSNGSTLAIDPVWLEYTGDFVESPDIVGLA